MFSRMALGVWPRSLSMNSSALRQSARAPSLVVRVALDREVEPFECALVLPQIAFFDSVEWESGTGPIARIVMTLAPSLWLIDVPELVPDLVEELFRQRLFEHCTDGTEDLRTDDHGTARREVDVVVEVLEVERAVVGVFREGTHGVEQQQVRA